MRKRSLARKSNSLLLSNCAGGRHKQTEGMGNDSTTQVIVTVLNDDSMVLPCDALPVPASARSAEAPAIIRNAGPAAQFAWDEFIFGEIRNPHTRAAYSHAIQRFLDWSHQRGIDLARITPRNVGEYLDSQSLATVTKKLHLAAIRRLFDFLVMRHAVILNPAASVRTERHQVIEGKTPEIGVDAARRLLASLDTSHVVGLRDRAILAVLIYTAARVGAVAKLRRADFYWSADQACLRFTEKGGKSREIPVRHDLQKFIAAYIEFAGCDFADKSSSLFRSTVRRTRQLTQSGLSAGDINRMVKRRLRDARLPNHLSPHSFRVTTITDLLAQGVALEDVQRLAGHADPRTTRLYDRRSRQITRNIVERISI
ncbi:MAG: tyrosine-type recombinase/integrase [Planctomycetaceae bacterium]|nr:tyrosine-type recombinase/integrase [Planctomycetaceae bacterium]